jgi:hypothetical protein
MLFRFLKLVQLKAKIMRRERDLVTIERKRRKVLKKARRQKAAPIIL